MARTKKNNGEGGSPVSSFQHGDAARLNIPEATETQAGLSKGKKRVYRYSPHLSPKLQFDATGVSDQVPAIIEKVLAGRKLTDDEAEILRTVGQQSAQPWLEWAAKQEQQAKGSFTVDDVVLHIHERISTQAILATARRQDINERDFFARPKLQQEQALQYYRHSMDWANRLILGDSLQVMNSLATRENLAGQVQMIFIDPPYGIRFSSNWQNELDKRDVKDKDEDVTREPEMIRAYRDTWTLGVHSYLTYLKQRFLLARELLAKTGSIFVQISNENLHRVRSVMDEVFGPENGCSIIAFVKTGGIKQTLLADRCDYLIWYARDKSQQKFNRQFIEKSDGGEGSVTYTWIESPKGERRGMNAAEKEDPAKLPDGWKRYRAGNITTQGNPIVEFEWQGKVYKQPWKTTPDGLRRMGQSGRLHVASNSLAQVNYLEDFPVSEVTSLWTDTFLGSFAEPKVFVVQTSSKTIQRCVLMTTDPGDLVLDPTCGSGTTAFVAEQWGRRWITIDSSRVAIAIARQRLLTASFDAYKTKDPAAGVDPTAPQNPAYGFYYKTAPHITLKSIAQNRNLDPIFAKHEPTLTKALTELNSALANLGVQLSAIQNSLVGKLKTKLDTDGNRSITGADLRRWLLPAADAALISFGTSSQRTKWKEAIPSGPGWQHWEVPFDTDPDWPEPLADALTKYRAVLDAKMTDVDSVIKASAEQENLLD